jgi:GH24 family phage-related lysozyme (muramidase)
VNDSLRRRVRTHIKHGEGSINHMYLDTVGKVTVGVGNMLPDIESAKALPFVLEDSSEPASQEDIKNDFENVSEQKSGMFARRYHDYTKLVLTEKDIDTLLDTRIDEFERRLNKDFSNYENCPGAVQLGLLDMAFNLGNSGLVNKFPTFCKAVKAEDWEACARECKRRGISDDRNAETSALFRECMTDIP